MKQQHKRIARISATFAGLILLATAIACDHDERIRLEQASPPSWTEMAHCLHNAGTSMPGDHNIDQYGKSRQTIAAMVLCSLELAQNRPEHLPDANCYADELDAYEAKYHFDRTTSWGRSRAYATLACIPLQTEAPTQ